MGKGRLDVAHRLARRVGSTFRGAVENLALRERRLLLVDTPAGLEPVVLWLGKSGQPLSMSAGRK